MPKVYVYDSYDNKFFRYNLGENDPMPYSTDTTLRVREFRGSSKANVLWTTTAAMEAWNLTRPHLRRRHPGGYAFKRTGRVATARRASTTRAWPLTWGRAPPLRTAARFTRPPRGPGAWGYVEPLSMTPTWVHFDRRYGKPRAAAPQQATPPCGAAAAARMC